MSDRFKHLAPHGRDSPDADWRCPWLRINVLLREMSHLLRDPSAGPVLKVELPKAAAMREKLRRHICWN